MYKRFNKGRVSVVRGRHSRRHCYHLFHLFSFSFSKVHRHLLSSEALMAYSLPVRRANKKKTKPKMKPGREGYLGYADGEVFQKILGMIGLNFHMPVFLESLGGSCFYIPKNFISPIIIIFMIILSSVYTLQGSLLQIFALQVSPLTCPLSKCFSLQNVFPNSTISCDPWSSLTRLTEWNRFQSRTILPLGGNAWAWKEAESSKGPRVLSEGFTLAWCGCTFPWLFGPP
ncbi:hypothetical protein M438DRAFT_123942 [Aureobasidium pullulans EXF-150]|uniref:Uncharacterized protein n=1 Tax=Aureobasidium pullulans EXF-150 TaxID=1043002 RepID=A0A074X336_AURPU|nr:uncharacterized protein M438DRAFT_123942 [Aureobasidium pullulans EXF-150]KEQ79935.1 hypothetical protein M438DRAFT_123942 [Aureobasidium pullulans EXF-150]